MPGLDGGEGQARHAFRGAAAALARPWSGTLGQVRYERTTCCRGAAGPGAQVWGTTWLVWMSVSSAA